MEESIDELIHNLELDYLWTGDPSLYAQIIQLRAVKQTNLINNKINNDGEKE